RSKANEWKTGCVSKTFEQHFVDVPGNGVKREKTVLVPWFLQNVRDVRVAKIKDRMEAHVIVKGGEEAECDGNNQKVNEHTRFFAGLFHHRFQIPRVGSDSSDQKTNENGQAKGQLGAITNRESKKCSRQE